MLLPIYLNIISVEQYGVYLLISSFSLILGVITGLKLESAFRIFYFDYNFEADKYKYLQTISTSILIISGITTILTIIFGEYIFSIFFGSDVSFYPFGFISVINIFIGSVNVLYIIDCQNRENRNGYVQYSLTTSTLTICFQYLGIVVLDLGVLSFFLSVLFSSCFQLIYIYFIGKFKIGKIDKEMLKNSLKYSLPLIPFLFLLAIEQQLDRFFLKKYHSLELLGVYALLIASLGIFSAVLNSLDNSIRPNLFLSLKSKDAKRDIKYYQYLYVGISLLAVFSVMIIVYILPFWVHNKKYLILINSVPLFGMSIIPLIYVRYFSLIFSLKKDSVNLSLISFLKILILIPIFYILVPIYGIEGILLSLFVVNFFNSLVFYLLIKYKHKFNLFPTYDVFFNIFMCSCFFIYWCLT
jgi:O-antigen/teichoic acid export membrane protein